MVTGLLEAEGGERGVEDGGGEVGEHVFLALLFILVSFKSL